MKVKVSFKVKVNFKAWPITFECLKLQTSFSLCRYIFKVSMSSLHMKVIGSRSRSNFIFGIQVYLQDIYIKLVMKVIGLKC